MNFFNNFIDISIKYNLDVRTFIYIYFISAVPVYLGAFLILHGSLKKIIFKDILGLHFSGIIFNSREVRVGILIFTFGWLMPYLYIIIYGKNLPFYIYILTALFSLSAFFIIFKSKIHSIKNDYQQDIGGSKKIDKLLVIDDKNLQLDLWAIYNCSFRDKNSEAPCQQSIKDMDDFVDELEEKTVFKYLLYVGNQLAGLAMVTNNLLNCTWISSDYFARNFPEYFSSRKLFYFMGIVVEKNYRNFGFAKSLLEYMIDDLPEGSAMGFDHSLRANKFIPFFTNVVKQRNRLERKYLDKQIYYLVEIKK